jgi:hypothetical protein
LEVDGMGSNSKARPTIAQAKRWEHSVGPHVNRAVEVVAIVAQPPAISVSDLA